MTQILHCIYYCVFHFMLLSNAEVFGALGSFIKETFGVFLTFITTILIYFTLKEQSKANAINEVQFRAVQKKELMHNYFNEIKSFELLIEKISVSSNTNPQNLLQRLYCDFLNQRNKISDKVATDPLTYFKNKHFNLFYIQSEFERIFNKITSIEIELNSNDKEVILLDLRLKFGYYYNGVFGIGWKSLRSEKPQMQDFISDMDKKIKFWKQELNV